MDDVDMTIFFLSANPQSHYFLGISAISSEAGGEPSFCPRN